MSLTQMTTEGIHGFIQIAWIAVSHRRSTSNLLNLGLDIVSVVPGFFFIDHCLLVDMTVI